MQQASVLCTRLAGAGAPDCGVRLAGVLDTQDRELLSRIDVTDANAIRVQRASSKQQAWRCAGGALGCSTAAASPACYASGVRTPRGAPQPAHSAHRKRGAAWRGAGGPVAPAATRWAAPASLAALTASLRRLRGSRVAKKKARVKKQQEASLGGAHRDRRRPERPSALNRSSVKSQRIRAPDAPEIGPSADRRRAGLTCPPWRRK